MAEDRSSKSAGCTSWVEVDAGALRHNFAEIKSFVGPSVKVMTVVKADAYGHGAVGASEIFAEAGADYLGVTTIEEALELRAAGITTPVLIFSPLMPDQMEAALRFDLEHTICDLGLAKAASETAVKLGKTARIHVKVDTGMGRLGVLADDCPDFMYRVATLDGIQVAGLYTHFANALQKDIADSAAQNERFSQLIPVLKSKEMPTGLCHAANSAGLLRLRASHYDMVRPGTLLYGQYPTRHIHDKLNLSDTWSLKARIIAVRKLPKGARVGYGSEFTTARPTIAAVIPVGYSDGFTLIPESVAKRNLNPLRMAGYRLMGGGTGASVTIGGQRAPVIGRISMQMCSVDVTDIPGVQVGDEVVVPARRTTVSARIPRVYV